MAQPPLSEPDRIGDGEMGEERGADNESRKYESREEEDKSEVWMVVQRRQNGRETFARTWNEYKYVV